MKKITARGYIHHVSHKGGEGTGYVLKSDTPLAQLPPPGTSVDVQGPSVTKYLKHHVKVRGTLITVQGIERGNYFVLEAESIEDISEEENHPPGNL